jgi:hypothetical protein
MRRAAVEKDHLLALKLDGDSGNPADGPQTDAFRTQLIEPARLREDAQVKLGGFFGVVIEPEEWRKFVHGWHGTSQEVPSDKPTKHEWIPADKYRLINSRAQNIRARSTPKIYVHENSSTLVSQFQPVLRYIQERGLGTFPDGSSLPKGARPGSMGFAKEEEA